MDAPSTLQFREVQIKMPEAGGVPPPAKVLDYVRVQQEQTNWCWAAVSKSVADYYQPGNAWTQGKIVNATLKREDCCDEGGSPACNQPWYVYASLDVVGHYAQKKAEHKPAYEVVKAEIEESHPLCVLIRWHGGGGHFVGVHGYDEAGEMLHVADPWYGESIVSHEAFPESYQGRGVWGWSYWTT